MTQTARPRERVIAWLIALPAIVTATAVTAVEIGRVVHPNSALFVMPAAAPGAFADAIAAQDALTTYELIRAGQDPRAPIPVRDPILTGGRSVDVLPVLWAVATESNQIVPLLLSLGADLDRDARLRAICLARQLGNDEVALVLEHHGERVGGTCPNRRPNEPAVLWLTQSG